MSDRPYTLLSCSVSLDGYLGDQTPRLALSNEADFDRVDEVRASCDAIMVGAVTVRTDNPRLLVRELRSGLLARSAWPAVALASALIIAGHVATFVIAAHTAGATAPASQILPLALLVLAAGALPNIGGWGPREGVTAWAFAAAGLGASRGVATAVVYGVMVFVASLPGAAVLVTSWVRRA